MPGLAAENAMLRMEVGWLMASVETLGPESKEMTTLAEDVRDLVSNSRKIRADAEPSRKRHVELAREVREKVVHGTVESALLKAVTEVGKCQSEAGSRLCGNCEPTFECS